MKNDEPPIGMVGEGEQASSESQNSSVGKDAAQSDLSPRERAQQRARVLGNAPSREHQIGDVYEPLRVTVFERDGTITETKTSNEGIEQTIYEPVVGDSGYLATTVMLEPGGTTTQVGPAYFDVHELPSEIRAAIPKRPGE